MKLNRFFMLGLAGLAFAACSNEEEPGINNRFPDGTGAVTVKLVNPALTKALQLVDPTDGTAGTTTIAITGDLTVSLYEKSDLEADGVTPKGTANPKQIVIDAAQVEDDTELKFWNVTEPGLITVSINGGQKDYSATSIDDSKLQSLPASIPAYGETTSFTLTANTDSPVYDNNNDGTNDGTEAGASEDDESTKYQMYTASVKMAIPVARLEVSGIHHKQDHGQETCEYTKLTIGGAYMDKLYAQGGEYAESGSKYSIGTGINVTDYCWLKDNSNAYGTGETAVLKIEIDGDETARSFLTGNWPAENKAFAFNFYVGAEMPIFKLYFDKATGSTNPKSEPRYAMITEYKLNGQTLTAFEAGKIYRITNAELVDGNILGDEGGNTLYGVVVTVEEATWSVVDISATWED